MLASRIMRTAVLAAMLAGLSAALPAAQEAPAATTAKFRATFTGNLQILLRPTGYQVVAWGSGTATGLGASVFFATGPGFLGLTTPVGACPQFSGVFSITGANNEKVFGTIAKSKGCRVSAKVFRSTGTCRILGGTGKFQNASGIVPYTASADPNGVFSITISGSL